MVLSDFSYLEKFIEENWTKEFFVEKSPPSITCMPQISKRFPDSNFILLKRNPQEIVLSQLNLFNGISEIGKRESDLGDLLFKKNGIVAKRERIMAKRLLSMIRDQITYTPGFRNRIELRYEDITSSLDTQLRMLEKKFNIKADVKKAQEQIKKPSYSSTFRYGLTKLSDKFAKDIIALACKMWDYQ